MEEQQQPQQSVVIQVAVHTPGQQEVLRQFEAPAAVPCSMVQSVLQQEFGPGSLCRDGGAIVLLPTVELHPGSYVYNVFAGGQLGCCLHAADDRTQATHAAASMRGTATYLRSKPQGCSNTRQPPGIRHAPAMPLQHAPACTYPASLQVCVTLAVRPAPLPLHVPNRSSSR
jgi:hypothetical protein